MSVTGPIFFLVFLGMAHSSAVAFTIRSSHILEPEAFFPGIVHDGNQVVIIFARNNNLFFRAYDTNFHPLDMAVQVTDRSDITDHKHILVHNEHYILYSTIGDEDLYLAKFDTDFNQLGVTTTVVEGSSTAPTNDMLLATDGSLLVTGIFRPSDRNNNETSGHLIKHFTTDLTPHGEQIIANPFNHVNTASIGFIDGVMGIVAPTPGVGEQQVQTQKDISLIRFNSNWQAVDDAAIVLVDGRDFTHWVGRGWLMDAYRLRL